MNFTTMNNFVSKLMAVMLCLVVEISGQQFGDCDYTQNMIPGNRYHVFNNGYPDNYANGTNCRWIASSDRPIEVSCNYRLPSSDKRSQDTLIIQDRFQTHGRRYQGNGMMNFVTGSHLLIIALTSSPKSSGGKFLCSLQTVTNDGESTACRCGWKNPSRNVDGHQETGVNEYPMMAGLIDATKRSVICGATIINEKQVLTAAHCVATVDVAVIGVLVGDHNLDSGSETNATKLFRVDSIKIHPKYNYVFQDYDIAIVTVTETISFDQQVGPVCLPFQHAADRFAGDHIDILGWGNTQLGGANTKNLQKTRLSVITNKKCQRSYKDLTTRQLCTQANGNDSFQYDRGCPVLWQNPSTGRIVEIGIVSSGPIGRATDKPGVNSRIGAFMDWIVANTPDGITYCEEE